MKRKRNAMKKLLGIFVISIVSLSLFASTKNDNADISPQQMMTIASLYLSGYNGFPKDVKKGIRPLA
jgi:hypothetical protein